MAAIKTQDLENPIRYTGLAYVDLMALQPANIISSVDGMKWIKTTRTKSDIGVNVPLLTPALAINEPEPESNRRNLQHPKESFFSHRTAHICHYCYINEWSSH